jgi:hypothetical protein
MHRVCQPSENSIRRIYYATLLRKAEVKSAGALLFCEMRCVYLHKRTRTHATSAIKKEI